MLHMLYDPTKFMGKEGFRQYASNIRARTVIEIEIIEKIVGVYFESLIFVWEIICKKKVKPIFWNILFTTVYGHENDRYSCFHSFV